MTPANTTFSGVGVEFDQSFAITVTGDQGYKLTFPANPTPSIQLQFDTINKTVMGTYNFPQVTATLQGPGASDARDHSRGEPDDLRDLDGNLSGVERLYPFFGAL